MQFYFVFRKNDYRCRWLSCNALGHFNFGVAGLNPTWFKATRNSAAPLVNYYENVCSISDRGLNLLILKITTTTTTCSAILFHAREHGGGLTRRVTSTVRYI